MKLGLIGACVAALISSVTSALAAPTYLTCSLDGLPPKGFGFTIDEQAGTVGILIKTSGHSRVVPAAYSPDKIFINEGDVRWMISRTDLRFSRTIKMIDSTTYGTCEIDAVPKRAF